MHRSRRFPIMAPARQRRRLSAVAFRAAGHAVTILRPANAYGPGQTMRGGFGLIRTMLEHARAGTAMEIWGDGENVRDFIYIGDVVEACIRFVALPQDSGTYNLGSGRGYSINRVRRVVEQVTGIELKVFHHPARGIDVRAVVLTYPASRSGCRGSRKSVWRRECCTHGTGSGKHERSANGFRFVSPTTTAWR